MTWPLIVGLFAASLYEGLARSGENNFVLFVTIYSTLYTVFLITHILLCCKGIVQEDHLVTHCCLCSLVAA